MGAKAEVDFQGEGAQILRTMKSIQDGFDKFSAALDRQEKETKKVAETTNTLYASMESGARSALRDVVSLATGWATVSGAIRLANNEYDKYKQKTVTQAATVEQFNIGISAAMQNAPTSFSRPQVEAIATSAASQAGVSPIMTANALAPTFAAGTGSMTPAQIANTVASAAQLSPSNQEDMTALASGAISFSQYLPGGQQRSPQEILGFLIGSSGNSEVDRLSFYVPEAAKVAAGARSYGFDIPESIAIFNGLTRGIKDDTGELSRTQTLSILKALDAVRKRHGLKTDKPSEVLKFILGKPTLARQVVDDLNTRAPTEGFVGDIFTNPSGVGAQFIGQAFANTPSMNGAMQNFAGQVQRMGGSDLAAAGRAGQAIGSIPQLDVLGNPQQAEASVIRGALQTYLSGSDSWALQDSINMAQYDAVVGAGGSDASDYVSGVLRNRIGQLTRPRIVPVSAGMGSASPVYSQPSPNDMRQAAILEQILAQLVVMGNNASQQPLPTNGDRPAAPFNPLTAVMNWWGSSESSAGKPGAY